MKSTSLSVLMLALSCAVSAQIDATWMGGTMGEGYSSPVPGESAHLEYRMFTTTSSMCAGVVAPARFDLRLDAIVLALGERLSLNELVLDAIDVGGAFVPRAPIAVDVYYEPGVLQRTDPASQEFVGVASGRGVVIFSSLCGAPSRVPVRVELPVRVASP